MIRTVTPTVRRAVLGGALVLALVASAVVGRLPDADAQPGAPVAAPESGASPATAPAATAPAPSGSAASAAPAAASAPADAAGASRDTAGEATHDDPAIIVERGGKRVRVRGLGDDRDYDSVGSFVKSEPELAGMVVAIVAIVFLSPVLLVGLVIWYRMRKTRMANETMLALAERGVVPSADAMQALGAGPAAVAASVAAAGTTSASAATVIDQARALRKQAAVSDLRKGVLASAVGLALTINELATEGTPGAFGLIVLFIGIAYCALWHFETRDTRSAAPSGPIPPAA